MPLIIRYTKVASGWQRRLRFPISYAALTYWRALRFGPYVIFWET